MRPAGDGEHVYCEIQKVGLTTFDVVNQLADAPGRVRRGRSAMRG